MSTPAKIKKLDEVVVNRIAAGEVIQRPANALKELIENSLDAKSTNIQITVKDGGLKSLQIQDNGTGIRKEDMEIVCERFTTSKLQKFEDLKSIATFGFRGEALASISHVAHLTITTKTAQSKVAYKASYNDGKLKSDIKSIAGNQGTTILIENLFYNVSTRRKALASPAEELTKISEVVTRYAIHNPHVGFTLKKQNEVIPVIRTPHNSTKTNNIKILYGNQVARELLDIELDNTTYKFKMQSLITNPNYSSKRMTLLLFINHRLVDSTPIKKMLEDLYSIYLPKKTHPWCYISLEINPNIVDVNVHPTKHEVRFLHEDTIIEVVKGALDEKLSTNSSSRTFYVQARLPQVDITKEDLEEVLPEYSKDKNKDDKKTYAKNMIRTDANDQKLDKFNFTINAKHDEINESIIDKNNDESVEKNFHLTCPSDALTTPEPTQPKEHENPQTNWDKIIDESSSQASSSTHVPENPKITVEISKPNDNNNQKNQDIIPDDSFVLMDSDDDFFEVPPQDNNNKSSEVDQTIKTIGPPVELQEKSQDDDDDDDDKKNENTDNKKETEKVEEKEKDVEISSPEKSIKSNDKIEPSQLSEFKSYSINNFRRPVHLTTVLQLRKSVEDNYHEGLKKILSEMSFIGCVKNDLVLFQSDVNLYICKTKTLAEELFYEIMLYDFANYGVLKFSDPLSLMDLAMLGLNTEEVGWTEDDGPKEQIAQNVTKLLIEKAAMLKEYFSIVIDKKGFIKSLPVLLDKYVPCPGALPIYILRLSTEVNWNTEKECFDGICRETAKFFSIIDYSDENYESKHMIEHVIYPAIKESLLPPKHFSHDSTILQVASLPNLYKVFERC